jgi:hypothetical protein
MLSVDQFLLCGDEDGTVQSKPPFLGGSLYNGFPLLVLGYSLYINDLIHKLEDLFLSPSKSVSQVPNSVYMFKTGFLNLLCMSRWLDLWLLLIGW